MSEDRHASAWFIGGIGKVIREWEEVHNDVVWHYIEHIRKGKEVLSYRTYANIDDSKSIPLDTASSLVVSDTSPLVSSESD